MVEGSGTKLLENSADAKCGVDEETFDLVYPQGDVPNQSKGWNTPFPCTSRRWKLAR
jgi:hypothetical protein